VINSVAERRRVTAERFGPVWAPSTFDRFLQEQAERTPSEPLILTDERTWTYSDVLHESRRVAAGLLKLGIQPGDRVAIVMANHPEFVPALFGAWQIGASVIPVNFLLQAEELAYVLDQSACSAVITMGSFRTSNYQSMFDSVAPGWSTTVGALQKRFANLRALIVHGETDRSLELADTVLTYQALGQLGAAVLAEASLPTPPHNAQDCAVVMYTSGTTGLPKGVIQTHDNLLRMAVATAHHRAFEPRRRILFALPLYHAFGLVEGLLAAIAVGGAIIPQLIFDPASTFRLLAQHRATELLMVPTMAVAVVEHPDGKSTDTSSLLSVLIGAAATPVPVWQKLKDVLGVAELFTGYGMTELTAAVTHTEPDDSLSVVTASVGRPKNAGPAGIAEAGGAIALMKAVDPFNGEDLPSGTEGELAAWGPTCTTGYFAKPVETEALLLPNGWVRSGDLGRVEADGRVTLTGRSKELYKSGGELVAPKEVEDVLSAHSAVSQAFVVGLPDPVWGEIGCAYLVLHPEAGEVQAEEFFAWSETRLAKFKRPRQIRFITADRLPLTPTGKVQKFRLIEMALA
jgi:fatty-acyl-CoA synthase